VCDFSLRGRVGIDVRVLYLLVFLLRIHRTCRKWSSVHKTPARSSRLFPVESMFPGSSQSDCTYPRRLLSIDLCVRSAKHAYLTLFWLYSGSTLALFSISSRSIPARFSLSSGSILAPFWLRFRLALLLLYALETFADPVCYP
jgi:hypothetical protein